MPLTTANGVELEYEVLGDEGPALLLVMGIGAQLIHWPDGFCRSLVDQGFRVIRFDNRDAGLSTKIEAGGVPNMRRSFTRALLNLPVSAPYTLGDMADDAFGLLDALEIESAHVVGVSMGGMIAQVMALSRPGRVRTLTSLLSTPGGRIFGKWKAMFAMLGRSSRTREEAIEKGLRVMRVIGSPGFPRPEEDVRAEMANAYDRCHCPRGYARQMSAILAGGSRRAALRSLRVPTLVVHGADDPLFPPRCGEATAESIPGSELHMVSGLGHDLPPAAWPILVGAIAGHARAREGRRVPVRSA